MQTPITPKHYALNASGKEAFNLGSMSAFGPGCVKTPSVIRFSFALAGGLDGAFCRWQ
jgi:hypothetical protein